MTLPEIADEFRGKDMAARRHRDVCRPADRGGECVSKVTPPFGAPIGNAQGPVRASSRKAVTVLIVDDDPLVIETFARLLRLEGYAVRTAVSAETGLYETEVSDPDAILLDLRMPVVDGLAFLRQLRAREHQRQTPVAIVTGDYFFDEIVSHELHELGAEVYFKPVWLDDLIQITESLVNKLH